MHKHSGIHFYINILNFNEVITDEETKTKGVTHAIHALDTFFASVGNSPFTAKADRSQSLML